MCLAQREKINSSINTIITIIIKIKRGFAQTFFDGWKFLFHSKNHVLSDKHDSKVNFALNSTQPEKWYF